MTHAEHTPVMLTEAIDALNIHSGACIVDGTFGRGGHSRLILDKIGPSGRLLAIDRDPEACAFARVNFANEPRLHIVQANFDQLVEVLADLEWSIPVSGILLDLGVSSPQLMNANRGFAFNRDGPLDMRMDPDRGPSAADWLADASEDDIIQLLRAFDEGRNARFIARMIVQKRQVQPITTTNQLAHLVSQMAKGTRHNKHPATKVFLALRSKTNNELGHLRQGLNAALVALAPYGRLVVISFHSLEDREVKNFFRRAASPVDVPRKFPMRQAELDKKKLGRIVGGPRKPTAMEVATNPRARSAMLRVFEKAS